MTILQLIVAACTLHGHFDAKFTPDTIQSHQIHCIAKMQECVREPLPGYEIIRPIEVATLEDFSRCAALDLVKLSEAAF